MVSEVGCHGLEVGGGHPSLDDGVVVRLGSPHPGPAVLVDSEHLHLLALHQAYVQLRRARVVVANGNKVLQSTGGLQGRKGGGVIVKSEQS